MTKETESPTADARLIGADDLMKLLRADFASQNKIDEESGSMGDRIARAAERKNLHRGAYAIVKKMMRMGKKDQAKLAELLFHFDHYRAAAEIDKLAGEDMLEDRKAKGKGAKKATRRAGAEADEDGEEVDDNVVKIGNAAKRVTDGAEAARAGQ